VAFTATPFRPGPRSVCAIYATFTIEIGYIARTDLRPAKYCTWLAVPLMFSQKGFWMTWLCRLLVVFSPSLYSDTVVWPLEWLSYLLNDLVRVI
jgi:hypothetical protein